MRRTVRPHARVGWWPEGAELHTLTSRHQDTPLGILGTLAAGDPVAKLGPAQSAPVHASPLPDQQCRSASPATGRARPVGGEGKEPEPDAATILKLDIASGAAGDSVCSTQVRQVSWVPQGQRGAPGIQTTSPGQGVGQGAGGRCRGSWWHGEAGGAHADLTDVHPLQSASLSLCLRLEPCQECSHPLMKKQSTFLSSLSRPHNAAPSQTPWSP